LLLGPYSAFHPAGLPTRRGQFFTSFPLNRTTAFFGAAQQASIAFFLQ